ncbi:MAG TPA: DNA polymerase III subunit delta [Candidatus Bipolaricaulota bacterium]|nr:DNA polymerase III subunit delta [Candidatus Bipolaricaulota bacterium]
MVDKKQIYVWSGENGWAISKQIQKWTTLFEDKYGYFNILKIDFEEKGNVEQTLKNALQVDSLFGQNKLIILKNFFAKKQDKKIEELILGSVEKLPEKFFVIFSQKGEIDKRSKIYKALAKAPLAEVKSFASPKGFLLNDWIKKQVASVGGTIANSAAERLAILVGNDLWQLDAEIQKLASYCRNREISVKDVEDLVKGKFNDNIFDFVDALSVKNKALSGKLLADQLGSGANQFYLLTMIVRQFRNILMIKDVKNSGRTSSPEFAARELKLHPFVAKKTWQQADRFTFEELKKIYSRLLSIEKKFKSTSWSPQLLLDLFVMGL